MPTSVPYCLPIVAGVARQLRPRSILDVGIGFGKYGFLLREFTDIWDMTCVADYERTNWKTRIDGVDATPQYITPLHRFIYNDIHIGDVRELIDSLPGYDLIIMGDLLEHFEKREGVELIDKLLARAAKCLLLVFPHASRINPHVLDNPREGHHSTWTRHDFAAFPHQASRVVEDYSCIVALAHDRNSLPLLTPHFAARRRNTWKQSIVNASTSLLGPVFTSRLASRLIGRKIALRS